MPQQNKACTVTGSIPDAAQKQTLDKQQHGSLDPDKQPHASLDPVRLYLDGCLDPEVQLVLDHYAATRTRDGKGLSIPSQRRCGNILPSLCRRES